jgi:two-component sensor histidine kinase
LLAAGLKNTLRAAGNAGNDVNDIADRMNGKMPDERPSEPNERQELASRFGDFPVRGESRHRVPRLIIIATILVFWTGRMASITLYRHLTMPDAPNLIQPRSLVCLAGAILSFGLVFALDSFQGCRLWVRTTSAIVLAICGAAVLALVNHFVFSAFIPSYGSDSPFWANYLVEIMDQLWIFACVSAMALALSYSADIREREERISALQTLAKDAQLSALRSQLNPHFLFNALNAIAALIKVGSNAQAEAMAENLADFLRMTLALDPQRLITVEEEVGLQQLYLDIQQARFPDRLEIHYDIAEGARQALVPNLIAQPLVENSIKYAVARSSEPVTLAISARADGSFLTLCIEDDGGDAARGTEKGARMGLRNVAERLRLQYGSRATFAAGPKAEGGFRNVLKIPRN